MRKICLVVAVLLVSSFLLFDVHVSSASPDPTLREYLNTGDAEWEYEEVYGQTWFAQSVTIGYDSPYTITSVKLKLFRENDPGIVVISIREAISNSDERPTGIDLTSTRFDSNILTTSASGAWYTFSMPEYPLQKTKTYTIVLRAPLGSESDYIAWKGDYGSGLAGEEATRSTDSGSTWAWGWPGQGVLDFMFEVWGEDSISWWNENWEYRMPIILEPHIENYQHRLFLDMTDNLGDNARSDFQDLRVISAGENILPIWRENWNSENVTLWYRKPENTYTYAWLYYGNAAALHTDNGDNVFVLFDNFDGESLDIGKWDNVIGTASVENSIISLENTGWETFKSRSSFSTPITLVTRAMLKGLNSGFGFMDDIFDYPMLYFVDSTPVDNHRAISGNVSGQITTIPIPSDNWHTYEIRHQTNPQAFYIDDNLKATHADQDISAALPIHFGSYSATQYLYVDWVLLRKFVAIEPAVTLGNARSYNAPPSTPTGLTLNAPAVGEILITEASGSTDNESITYYYSFYNQTDAVLRQGWSIENTYTIILADAHDNLKAFARAYDGEGYSDNFENSIIVTNTLPTIPTDYTNLGLDENSTPIISWTRGTDVDNDILTTFIYLGDNTTPTEVDNSTTGETFTLGENASHSTYPLASGDTYYYRLRSWDNYGYSSYTMADMFKIAVGTTITLYPTDDSYVDEDAQTLNYENLGVLEVQTQSPSMNKRSFLKFDLSAIPDDNVIFVATLRLYCTGVMNVSPASYVEVRKVWDDNWSENSITWINQPAYLGIAAFAEEPVLGWVEWDLTDYVEEQLVDDNLSMCLKSAIESSDIYPRLSIYQSKESIAPELVVTYGDSAELPWENVIITSTVGGATIPPVDNYQFQQGTFLNLEATANDGYIFDHWEISIPDYVIYENENSPMFGITINAESFFHAVFTGSAPPTILSLFPTIIAIAIALMFSAIGFGASKRNPTIGVLFLLFGIMLGSVFGLLPEWFFIVPLIALGFLTLWKFSGREQHD